MRNLLRFLTAISTLGAPFLTNAGSSQNSSDKMSRVQFMLVPESCVPEHPAINDFPPDYFTEEQRKSGFVFLHIIFVIYLFFLLAALCDFYFVPSLQNICVWLRMESDVAGATLMSIGSSAPTLFISIISVFFTTNAGEIGLGTIVGSTIFNTLFIISATGFAVTKPLKVKWFPIMRDSIAYLISTVALVVSVSDKEIHWYEAFIFVIIYSLYVVVMIFNRDIENLIYYAISMTKSKEAVSESIPGALQPLDFGLSDNDPSNMHFIDYIGPFEIPTNSYHRFVWFTSWPLILLVSVFIPKIMKDSFIVAYEILRFFISIALLGALSYILVWMVCVISFTFSIPDCVIGMTLLAAGSSIPDVMASVVVARQDQAGMAISNAIGSNVFDMLCLGLPWLIKTTIFKEVAIKIESDSLILSTSLLIGTMLYTMMSFYLNRWMIDKRIGYLFLMSYAAIIGFATIVELLACPCNLHF